MNMQMSRAMRRQMTSTTNFERANGAGAIRQPRPLTNEEMIKFAPSIFAQDKFHERSERYTYIPTIMVIEGLRKEGWQPVSVAQGGTRHEERRGFTRHVIRMRKDGMTMRAVGDVLPELVLKNAHDGTASYELMSGWFRLACLNGMVVADRNHPEYSIKFPHKGDIIPDVIEGSYRVIDEMAKQQEQIKQMAATPLRLSEQRLLAEQSMTLRFADRPAGEYLTPDSILAARRQEDTGNDLWMTFQRIQENLTKGGQRYMTRDTRGRDVRRTVRPVQGVDADTALNKALWMLASEMLLLKQAA